MRARMNETIGGRMETPMREPIRLGMFPIVEALLNSARANG